MNDQPVATSETVNAVENTDKSFKLNASDPDGTTGFDFIITSLPTNGSITDADIKLTNDYLPYQVSTNKPYSENIIYTSTSDTATTDSFNFKVKDYSGNDDTNLSENGTITFNIEAVNDKPIASTQTVEVTEQTEITITLSGTDPEDDSLSYIVVTLPSNGVLSESGTEIKTDDLPKSLSSSELKYLSTSDSATSDSFTFKANDGSDDSDAASITINITGVNDAPSLENQSFNAKEGKPEKLDLSDVGSDPDGDTLSYILLTLPSNGTISNDGVVVTESELPKTSDGSDVIYTVTTTSETSDSFTFKVSDGQLESNEATATVNIELLPRITLSTEKSEIFEHEKTTITATLDSALDQDLNIRINLSGDAIFEKRLFC